MTRSRWVTILPAIVAAVAIGGVLVALADDPPKGPLTPNQGVRGKADTGPSTTMPAATALSDPAGAFQRAFKSAATATEKRDLAMKACEDGLIHSRMGLNDLKKLFGDSPLFILHPLDEKTGKQSAFLGFKVPDPEPAPGEPVAATPSYHGWFMWFFFEHDELELFYLANNGGK